MEGALRAASEPSNCGDKRHHTVHSAASQKTIARYPATDLRNVDIIITYKRELNNCGNYRGIALASTAGKILARVTLNRFLLLSEDILPESQCSFRTSRETTDMIFVAQHI